MLPHLLECGGGVVRVAGGGEQRIQQKRTRHEAVFVAGVVLGDGAEGAAVVLWALLQRLGVAPRVDLRLDHLCLPLCSSSVAVVAVLLLQVLQVVVGLDYVIGRGRGCGGGSVDGSIERR